MRLDEEFLGSHDDCGFTDAPKCRATFSAGFIVSDAPRRLIASTDPDRSAARTGQSGAGRPRTPHDYFLERVTTRATLEEAREFYSDKPAAWLRDERASFQRMRREDGRNSKWRVWLTAFGEAERTRASASLGREVAAEIRRRANRPDAPPRVTRFVSGGLPTLGRR